MRMAIPFFLLAFAGQAAATPLTADQAFLAQTPLEVRLSPDGKLAAATVEEDMTQTKAHVYVAATGGEWKRLTSAATPESSPRFSPDSKKLAFIGFNANGTSGFYLATLGAPGDPEWIATGTDPVGALEWSQDGTKIAVLASDPVITPSSPSAPTIKPESHQVTRLYVVDLATHGIKVVSDPSTDVQELAWVPGSQALLALASAPVAGIYSYPVDGGAGKLLAATKGQVQTLRVSPDAKVASYIGSRNDEPLTHDLYFTALDTATSVNATGASLDELVQDYRWAADGSLLLLTESGVHLHFLKFLGGTTTELPLAVGPQGAFDLVGTQLIFSGAHAAEPTEIWTSNGTTQTQASHFNQGLAGVTYAMPEVVMYPSFDGTPIEGILYRPVGGAASGPYPLIVSPHGGPTGSSKIGYSASAQLLAAGGFAVFQPNFRGSTGYGLPFAVVNRYDWGGGDYKDVMAGVDYLVSTGIADADRLAIGGWSYGGYLAEWAVTQTKRFKAAISGAGMANLLSEFGTESDNSYDAWFNGNPYLDPTKLPYFLDRSAVSHMAGVTTPTLILQGKSDTTDPIGQSQELFAGFQRQGAPATLVLYPNEPHGFHQMEHLVDRALRTQAWYAHYLLGTPFPAAYTAGGELTVPAGTPVAAPRARTRRLAPGH